MIRLGCNDGVILQISCKPAAELVHWEGVMGKGGHWFTYTPSNLLF